MMRQGGFAAPFLVVTIFLVVVPKQGDSILHRTHLNTSLRNLIYPSDTTDECDSIMVDNYFRGYRRGPVHDEFSFFTHDVIAAFAGPGPPSNITDGMRTIRVWAMFDEATKIYCDLNEIQDYGEEALFSCPSSTGFYIAYASDVRVSIGNVSEPKLLDSKRNYHRGVWKTRQDTEIFNLLLVKNEGVLKEVYNDHTKYPTPESRIDYILQNRARLVSSDPFVVKSSHFCYYWMLTIKQQASSGFQGKLMVPPSANATANDTSYILLELRIWVAEPTAVELAESDDRIIPEALVVSEYSKVITNRFHDTGLFPCLRKAHKVIEVLQEISYVSETDQGNHLGGAPHWLAYLKIHTDRLISTLSDVTFTIASRQSTGSFHCFVGDSKVYVSVREFQFVAQQKLEQNEINFDISGLLPVRKLKYKHQIEHLYGHGVQFIGNKFTKLYQPATTRTDMIIVNNPCIAQEFAMSVAGSLYIAHGYLRFGVDDATRVVLPDFSFEFGIEANPDKFRNYLRVSDVAFTPTHAVMLMSDGSVLLHPTSTAHFGIGQVPDTAKYRPSSLVKRKSCPKTSTPKYSGMKVPMFSRTGNIIVLHLYSIEGSVRMWLTPPSTSCVTEGGGNLAQGNPDSLINEADIHYEEYRLVDRTDHKTGLKIPKPPARPKIEPSTPKKNPEELTAYLMNDGELLGEGLDPHFPPGYLDPARHLVGSELEHYNSAVIYALENEKQGLEKLMEANGIALNEFNIDDNATDGDYKDVGLYAVEFAAVEKTLIIAVQLKASPIPKSFGVNNNNPFQMVITTVTSINYPFRLKLQTSDRQPDENVDTIVPFPGTILVRSKPFTLKNVKSNDPQEEAQHTIHLKGKTEVEFTPEIFIMNTAIPSYVINLGDILVYTSLESRYARPLHFYDWNVIHDTAKENREKLGEFRPKPLTFDRASIEFFREGRLHDAVVSEQGIISVLWRKEKLYHEDEDVKEVEDAASMNYTQTVAIGSVVSLDGLREVKPFFRHDNIFQRLTPDGEVIYGVYSTKPHSPLHPCNKDSGNETRNWGACLYQAEEDLEMGQPRYCTRGMGAPCLSPAELPFCPDDFSGNQSCILINKTMCLNDPKDPMHCWPLYAPLEEIRTVNLIGTPFLSHLLGSLSSVKSVHPEAPPQNESASNNDNFDAFDSDHGSCPFSSFKVYRKDFDFAEVGYQTRITGEVSYFGTAIPTEADLIVEFDNMMGAVVDVSTSVEEYRGLTTIRKTIDISFQMTDFILNEFNNDVKEESDLIWGRLEFDDIRAREKSAVFSITVRPSIVDNHCKRTDYFKTVQFNVGCNTFSTIRLISEAAPFTPHRLNKVTSKAEKDFKWITNENKTMLTIPRAHLYYKQAKNFTGNKIVCEETGKLQKCTIPYHDLFHDNVFTVSYRDHFYPKFEQFVTVSARPVTGNIVMYDMVGYEGKQNYKLTTNNLQAGCHNMAGNWYQKLFNSTQYIKAGSTVHENIYKYFKDCFDVMAHPREQSLQLSDEYFRLHNLTNNNRIKFEKNRNQILIFRAVVVNTEYNRFTYCKTLEYFFLVRVVGIPIPRQGLGLLNYFVIFVVVFGSLVCTYLIFYNFYTWKVDSGEAANTSSKKELMNENEKPL